MMNWLRRIFTGFRKDQSGIAMIYMTIALPAILGIISFGVDLGYVYYVKTRLQTAADMGALAGASLLYTDTSANVSAQAKKYVDANLPVSWTTGLNPMATSTQTVMCLSTITAMGLTCSSASGGNSLNVKVDVTVPLFFAKVLGMKTIKLSTDAMVTGGGSSPPPLNVAIVLDATASMASSLGTSCGSLSNPKKIECATLAAKTLMSKLWAGVDQVALYTYPAFNSGTNSQNMIACKSGATGSITALNYQTGSTPNYRLIDFNDLYADTSVPPTGGLKTTAPIVLALGKNATAGASDSTTCNGLNGAAIGMGTSIADAITQAQQDLVAANTALVAAGKPKRQNVLVVLSDGDANGNSGSCTGTDGANNDFITGMGLYGTDCRTQWVIDVARMADQCQAAVTAADAAAAAGTWVYSVAFDALTGSGKSCFTDRPLTTVTETASTTPKISASETFVRNCTSAWPCAKKSSATNTVTSIIAPSVTSGSAVTQQAFTAWGGTIATTCSAADGKTSGTCTTTVTNGTKIQTDTYNLKLYDTTACATMIAIASDASKFYSTDGSTNCASTANPNFTDLVKIFNNVAASIMKKRRIPNTTT